FMATLGAEVMETGKGRVRVRFRRRDGLTVIVTPRNYAFAVAVALAASIVSGLLVRRKLDHLDLIGVLKTRE
ncbi:MAG: hypothetical protein KC731_15345, partial [Myxococcales bacterium]|nr:hypothetical protein [Myxococcales bacterium]